VDGNLLWVGLKDGTVLSVGVPEGYGLTVGSGVGAVEGDSEVPALSGTQKSVRLVPIGPLQKGIGMSPAFRVQQIRPSSQSSSASQSPSHKAKGRLNGSETTASSPTCCEVVGYELGEVDGPLNEGNDDKEEEGATDGVADGIDHGAMEGFPDGEDDGASMANPSGKSSNRMQ
jgi:hypothetical protein